MNEERVVETERLMLRMWKMDDVDDIVEGLNNLNVSRWLADVPYLYTKDDAKEFINYSIENNLYNFAIVLKDENKVIGGTQISNINYHHKTAGGGIWINEKYQGKGYGTEAFRARIKYAFGVLNLRKLENGFFNGNEKSWNMQEKLGYKLEGLRRKKFISKSTGNIEDEYITGLLIEEFNDDYDEMYPNDEFIDYTGKLNNHIDYIKMLDVLEEKCKFIEIVGENEIALKFKQDILFTKKVSSWWSEETSLVENLYRIKASKELFDSLKKYETFCKYIPNGQKSIFGYTSDLVKETDFGYCDIAFFDKDSRILLKTVTHEGFIAINDKLKIQEEKNVKSND